MDTVVKAQLNPDGFYQYVLLPFVPAEIDIMEVMQGRNITNKINVLTTQEKQKV